MESAVCVFDIRHKTTGATLASIEAHSFKQALEIAIGNHTDLTGADLRTADLRGADLTDADLTGATLRGATLRSATLRDADLRTADLTGATLRSATLRGATLRSAILRGATLRGAILTGADLRDADLRTADLRGADLRTADLTGATLEPATLTGAKLDARLVVPNLDQAILAALAAGGTFAMPSWQTCQAGWAIYLAGDAGKNLEAMVGAETAGAFIYDASAGYIPDFYTTTPRALADIRAHAAAGTSREDGHVLT